MNVLVYSGPEVLQASLSSVLSSLRALLLPHYIVQPIEHTALAQQPWTTSCALLVFPRLDQPFTAPAHSHIQSYVDRGGAFLAFGAGARCSTRGIISGMDGLSLGSSTSSLLKFYDKFNNAYIHPTFSGDTAQQRLVKLESLDGDVIRAAYESSPGEFTGFKGERGIRILGRYLPSEDIAGLGSDIGGGRIALWSPALEQSLSSEPASSLASTLEDDIAELDAERRNLLRRTLIYLGLHLPASSASTELDDDLESRPIARPFPQLLVSSPDRPEIVARIVDSLSKAFQQTEGEGDVKAIKDENDTLHFHEFTSSSTKTLLEESKSLLTTPSDPSTWQPKHIIIHRDGTLPPTTYINPYFNISKFFQHLSSLRPAATSVSQLAWPLGSALFVSPAVTSTQTLLDKNPLYLSSLPTPTVHIASHQLVARGRGSNAWLSPSGSLSQSIHLRLSTDKGVPSSKLVFVQYLYALAVCEGVRDDNVLGDGAGGGGDGEGWRVRIKWPNDVYALVGTKGMKESEMEKKKIAGILVSMTFGSAGADIIIGCGLNVFNEHPMTSLVQLLKSSSPRRKTLSIERTAAVILTKFEQMWNQFVDAKGSFEPFLDAYLKRWMHSDQRVTLTTVTPPIPVRITGITLDHGLLRTTPERLSFAANPYFFSYGSRRGGGKEEEEYIDLQPDGNSFDLMAGMIKAKH
ncbi:hypothetical protein D9756_008701 [Leucocoprinus leucothites]|uniref:BPL/LPL catalytic domain-containing protein n=1 Tax=Leucocoprinus leucothites TaxID=201217 RepID=A0A8H5D0J7_9AGAR|nr:hypothetical protein D9756_008701 [Leucoagaricus leucothites]